MAMKWPALLPSILWVEKNPSAGNLSLCKSSAILRQISACMSIFNFRSFLQLHLFLTKSPKSCQCKPRKFKVSFPSYFLLDSAFTFWSQTYNIKVTGSSCHSPLSQMQGFQQPIATQCHTVWLSAARPVTEACRTSVKLPQVLLLLHLSQPLLASCAHAMLGVGLATFSELVPCTQKQDWLCRG